MCVWGLGGVLNFLLRYSHLRGGLPDGTVVKNLLASARDMVSTPGLGRSPGVGNGNPLQYSCLEIFHGQRSLAGYSPWGRRVGHS